MAESRTEPKVDILDLIYIVKGFLGRFPTKLRTENYKHYETEGELEFLSHLEEQAEALQQFYFEGPFRDEGFDGVWVYDVAEPFGEWLAEYIREHNDWPSRDEVTSFLYTESGTSE